MNAFFNQFVTFMNAGGVVMWVLFALNLLLWFGLGYRYSVLQRGTRGNVRRQINKHLVRKEQQAIRGLLDEVIRDCVEADKNARAFGLKARNHIEGVTLGYMSYLTKYGTLVKTIVVLAPLIGLLGTVMGMIETFDALQSSAMFSQGTSISGGISKALFTTELGLVVAVPGLIFGRILDKKEERFALEFEQITDILCTEKQNEI